MEYIILVTDEKGNELEFKNNYQAVQFIKSARKNYKKYLNKDITFKTKKVFLTTNK
ncbi:MAG: hypothetical protein GOVbin2181_5 [Prokaryotic dsDNA virus sp.]|nr:MAG: hypothetical protein GOVbin2181_5 [Prokaryotic dsDNA virus sp.]|tara:strand:+ start:30609 stop:30776 length:168 start_codon:yes stop_codon:yes gene_type:complete